MGAAQLPEPGLDRARAGGDRRAPRGLSRAAPAYLNKQLQALARAGIVASVSGPKGGFRLARALDRITLMDVVAAVEGPDEAFRCTEIRQQGPGAGAPGTYAAECAIAGAMGRADLAWRRELMAQTLDDVRQRAELQAPAAPDRIRHWFANV